MSTGSSWSPLATTSATISPGSSLHAEQREVLRRAHLHGDRAERIDDRRAQRHRAAARGGSSDLRISSLRCVAGHCVRRISDELAGQRSCHEAHVAIEAHAEALQARTARTTTARLAAQLRTARYAAPRLRMPSHGTVQRRNKPLALRLPLAVERALESARRFTLCHTVYVRRAVRETRSNVRAPARPRRASLIADIKEGLREVRRVLLEADVNFQLTREFLERVEKKSVGVVAAAAPSRRRTSSSSRSCMTSSPRMFGRASRGLKLELRRRRRS